MHSFSLTRNERDLYSFLNRVLPAEAVQSHLAGLQALDRCTALSTRGRRKFAAVTSPRLYGDFADWTAAQSTIYQEREPSGPPPPPPSTPSNLSEVYLARWLRTTPPQHQASLLRPDHFVSKHKRHKGGTFSTHRTSPLNNGSRDSCSTPPQLPNNNNPPLPPSFPQPPQPPDNHADHHSPAGEEPRSHHPVGGVSRILCHAAAYSAPCNYVFGGLTVRGCSDQLWSLQLPATGWQLVNPKNSTTPPRRYNHTLLSWNDKLILFGGDAAPGYLEDLWYFDIESSTWDNIPSTHNHCPGARAGHSAVLFQDSMIVFGGWRGSDGFSDVWSCDLATREWSLLSSHTSRWSAGYHRTERESLSSDEEEENEFPEARQWHVSAIFGNWMYVHGGYGLSAVLRHVWRFNIRQRRWEFVPVKGREPAARCRHSAAALSSSRWAILGGKDAMGGYFGDMYIFHIQTSTWQPVTLFSPPCEIQESNWWTSSDIIRQLPFLHCQAISYDDGNGVMVITGGCDGDVAASDSTILVKRFSAAALLFREWEIKEPHRLPERCQATGEVSMDLPKFINTYPHPFSDEILRFL